MYDIDALPAFNDNYIWLISQQKQAAVVDPGNADVVIEALAARDLTLVSIIITHWHPDHVGGIEKLLANFPDIEIFGPQCEKIPLVNKIISDLDSILVLGLCFEVLAIPGHTLEHLAFFCPQENIAFVGDTLFAAGCGRMFEGDSVMFTQSLQRLSNLPEQTSIYCAHEYTLSNLAFAAHVEPNNEAIQKRIKHCQKLRDNQIPTVPFMLQEEFQTNPFLRLDQQEIIKAALNKGAQSESASDVFSSLREWKDSF